jgi:hypothetical protein
MTLAKLSPIERDQIHRRKFYPHEQLGEFAPVASWQLHTPPQELSLQEHLPPLSFDAEQSLGKIAEAPVRIPTLTRETPVTCFGSNIIYSP